MDAKRIDDALSSLTKKELEALRDAILKELMNCVICGSEGALRVRGLVRIPNVAKFTILICKPCIEKNRLPESRSTAGEILACRAGTGYVHFNAEAQAACLICHPEKERFSGEAPKENA